MTTGCIPFSSSDYAISIAIIIGLSVGLSIVLTLVARKVAPSLGLIALPGGRRQHGRPVSRFGALPLWGAFTLTVIIAQFMPVPHCDGYEGIRLVGLLLGGTFIFGFGLLDDKFDLPALPQYIAQIIAAGIGVAFLIFIQQFHNPFSGDLTELPYIVTVIVSLTWLGLMMNTLNWLDGMDGLAAGVTFIAALLLFIHALRVEDQYQTPLPQWSVSLLPLALMGAILGFLIFNWHPASIFMGSGAVYLGYTLGALSIIGGAKMATILLVMGLPLLDVVWQVARRIITGKDPSIGDRGHIHFRLIDANLPTRWIVSGYYFFCALFGVISLVIPTSQFKLIALLIMVALVILGFAVVTRLSGPLSSGEAGKNTSDSAPEV